jgi:integrase
MRIVHKPTSLTHSYRLFAPTGKSRIYRIMERSAIGQFTTVNEDHPRYAEPAFKSLVIALGGLNAKLKTEQLSPEMCRVQVQLVIEQLYRLDGCKVRQPSNNSDNDSLVAEYLRKRIDRKKTKQVSKTSASQYLYRAIRAIGNVSLRTAPIEDIQDALDKAYTDHRQRALATKLNSLLKFAGRHDVRVEPNRPVLLEVRYMEFKQLEPVLKLIRNSQSDLYSTEAFAVMCEMAMYTGLRIGELMAVTARDLQGNILRVMTQLDTDGVRDNPKWGKVRTVAIFDRAVKLYPTWLKLRSQVPHEVRLRAARIFKDACMRAYPDRKELWLKFHDLRHSFAVRCLEQGLSLELIAKQLGNSVRVCEMYYVGFVHTNTTLEQTAKLLNRPA